MLPAGLPQPSAGVDADVERLNVAVRTAGFTEICAVGLGSSIAGAKAAGATGAQIEEKAKEFHLGGYLAEIPHLATALRAVDPRGRSLVEYSQALNVAAGFNPNGSKKKGGCAQQ